MSAVILHQSLTLPPLDLIHQYADSVYQTVATITTTGYGDFHAVTLRGRMLAVGVMVAGFVLFSYILGKQLLKRRNSSYHTQTHPPDRYTAVANPERS